MPTTLLAVTGMSPAIVTETVWALANEKPRTLPNRVVLITTSEGKKSLERDLFTATPQFGGLTVWEALRKAVKAQPDELLVEGLRIIDAPDAQSGTMKPLPDIRTPAENTAAANFILEQVRAIVEHPEQRLIASIAGGRKTMGALLYAAVTLLGRETDRLTHVLVKEPFDSRLTPPFYFPTQPATTHDLRNFKGELTSSHSSKTAGIELADIPFVPLRNRFEDIKDMPGSFDGVVRKIARQSKADASRPSLIEISHRQKLLTVDGVAIKASPRALAILRYLLECQTNGIERTDRVDVANEIINWLRDQNSIPVMRKPKSVAPDDVSHDLSAIRTALSKTAVTWAIPKGGFHFPPFLFRHAE